jgi:hypothetical protein
MAAVAGKQGKILYKGGHVVNLGGWSLDQSVDMLDVTDLSTGTVQSRDFIPGLLNWSGSINGNADSSSTGQTDIRTNTLTPATGNITLYIDKVGGENYTGAVYWQTLNYNVDVEGKAELTLGFQGTATLTYATTT